MAGTRYLALLRGVNVGGRRNVSMADLRATFEAAGHTAVSTYIQSGNVLFTSTGPRATVEAETERMLEALLGAIVVVVRTHRQLRAVVDQAPAGFGEHEDRYHSDVIFLRAPLTAAQVMKLVELREGVDRAWPGRGVVYFERLSAERTRSKLSTIVGTSEYALMTIRSWSTVTKLLALLDQR